MKFKTLVAVVATLSIAAQVYAAENVGQIVNNVAQSEEVTQAPAAGVVILNTNTNSNTNTTSASTTAAGVATSTVQPATVVEAVPGVDSRAESLRKARQNAELQTQAIVVEKLEESRLREEQQRAQRLFGTKIEAQTATTTVTTPVAAPVATQTVAPVVAPAEVKPTQVTIEKVEIIQPAASAPAVVSAEAPVVPVATPVITITEEPVVAAKSVLIVDDGAEKKEKSKDRLYVTGLVGAVNYDASNVKSNGAVGIGVGMLLKSNWSVEASYLYSNHNIDTFWQPNLYRDLNQHDIQGAAKYYFQLGKIKPFVGGSATYIVRKYSDRVINNYVYTMINNYTTSEETHSLNVSVLGGVDFEIDKNILVGASMDWSANVANNNGIRFSDYGLPENTKALEEMRALTFKLNAKLLF